MQPFLLACSLASAFVPMDDDCVYRAGHVARRPQGDLVVIDDEGRVYALPGRRVTVYGDQSFTSESSVGKFVQFCIEHTHCTPTVFCSGQSPSFLMPDLAVALNAEILVATLGDPRYRNRVAAQRALVVLRGRSIAACRAGLKSSDLEISSRCRIILDQIRDMRERPYVD